MSSCRSFLFVLAVAVAAASSAPAQFGVPVGQRQQVEKSVEVRELVSKYCRLDYDGARLRTPDWPKLQPLVWWKSSPEYSQINVISRYTVEAEPTLNHGKYNVTVQYRLLGSFDLVTGYIHEPANSVQEVNYTVSAVNDEWRISEADNTLPHPSRIAMVKWLNEKAEATQDPSAKKLYEEALRQLQAPPAR